MNDLRNTKQVSIAPIAALLIAASAMIYKNEFDLPSFLLMGFITTAIILFFAIIEIGTNSLFDKIFDETKNDLKVGSKEDDSQ